MSAVRGLWTPWADVLCLDCHGPSLVGRGAFPDNVWAARLELVTPTDSEGMTRCDKCKCEIVVRKDVAELRELGHAVKKAFDGDPRLKEARMWQTGGMCAALGLMCRDGSILQFTNLDTPDGEFCVWRWSTQEAYDNGEDEEQPTAEGLTTERAIEWLRERLK